MVGFLYIEVAVDPLCKDTDYEVQVRLRNYLRSIGYALHDVCVNQDEIRDKALKPLVQKYSAHAAGYFLGQRIELSDDTQFKFYTYRYVTEGPSSEYLDDADKNTVASSHWILPNKEFEGYWETLHYDSVIKQQLIQYARTMLKFSDQGVSTNLLPMNRVILLHGPPGTGKTTLCKALAQKLCILFGNRFKQGMLIEVHSHSLFSKWFSESGKLVSKMFQRIEEFIENEETLVFVLIDEVESLTAARKASMRGNEPSDALRVVNAMLTQIDSLRRFPNVLILTTSNLSEAMDVAFIDRADVKLYIPPPSVQAIYEIYRSCLNELIRAHVIRSGPILYTSQQLTSHTGPSISYSMELMQIAQLSVNLSGRTLRKLPIVAHSLIPDESADGTVDIERFFVALRAAVARKLASMNGESSDGIANGD